jgi:hypothetical protein
MGDTRVLHRRFVERENTPERGNVNKMFAEVLFCDFDGWCRNLDSFDVGGKVMRIDTTDYSKVDYQCLIETARKFLNDASFPQAHIPVNP